VYAFGFPLLAMTVSFILRRDFIDFHSSLLGFVFNCATTFLLTNALKVSIGRPRPHFFIVCFPSGVPVYGSDGNAQCNGSSSSVMESRVSFPSGHTSMSFSGLTYAALFLAAKLQAFSARGRGQLWRLVPSACCLAGAASVGITRIDDYWHFPFDVFMGGLIGAASVAITRVDDYWPLGRVHRRVAIGRLNPRVRSVCLMGMHVNVSFGYGGRRQPWRLVPSACCLAGALFVAIEWTTTGSSLPLRRVRQGASR
ncbi:unnamed protein product, partial [Closterium sp. NIES-54]